MIVGKVCLRCLDVQFMEIYYFHDHGKAYSYSDRDTVLDYWEQEMSFIPLPHIEYIIDEK